MIIGHDHLGIGHKLYDVKSVIKTATSGECLGAFLDVFGDAFPAIRKCLASGKYAVFRGHCEYNKDHTLIPIDKLKKMLPKCEKLAKDFPNVEIYISHTCEYYPCPVGEVKKRIDLIKQLAPSCIPVNSPMKGAPILENVITEWHVTPENHETIVIKRPGDFISTDGMSCVDIDIVNFLNRNKEAACVFLWAARYNLREGKDPQPAPKDRTAIPNSFYMKSIGRLMLPIGTPPNMPDTIKLEKPELYKTHAEDMEGSQSRDNKPCLILFEKVKVVTILDKRGQDIGKLQYYDTFVGGMHRYYSGIPGGINTYGYQIGDKAASKSNSEWVYLKVGKKIYGPIHPAFRTPWFR